MREVRVIDEDGQQLGILPTFEALRTAREKGLDLVEVAPQAVPPVCRILDFGRFKYEQQKKEAETRKNAKVIDVKEVRLTPTTGEHDIETAVRKAKSFLEDGDKVKVWVKFKGREIAHPQLGREMLDKIATSLQGTGTVERGSLMEGRIMSMIVTPVKQSVPAAQPRPDVTPVARPTTNGTPPAPVSTPPQSVPTVAVAAPARPDLRPARPARPRPEPAGEPTTG